MLSRGLLSFVACGALVGPSSAWAQCEEGQLTSPKGEVGNLFGTVSISGDAAVVGDPAAFSWLGAAFVFRRGPDGRGDWLLEAVLMSPEPDPDEFFGWSVVSGDVIIVQAPDADAPEFHSGAVYIYRYERAGSGQWKYEATLTASDGDFGDIFGRSVSIDGDVLLVGARDDENDGVPCPARPTFFAMTGKNGSRRPSSPTPMARRATCSACRSPSRVTSRSLVL